MPESFARISPLADLAIHGRFGADHGTPGVTLSVQHPAAVVTVIARKGKAKALADALKAWRGARVQWAGAEQYFVLDKSYEEAAKKLEGLASCSDQSHGDSTLSVKNISGGALSIRLSGTNVGEYGRLIASGGASLGSGGLLPSAGFNPQAGQVYTIVEKAKPQPRERAWEN